MRKYKTGYIASSEEVSSKSEIFGKYFSIIYEPKVIDDRIKDDYYVIIKTKDFQNARKVNQLIASSLSLIDARNFFTLDSIPQLVPLEKYNEEIPKSHSNVMSVGRLDIPEAINIATKASFKRKYYLSLLKYQLACELHSNDIMDLYPQYYNLSRNPADHLRIANAIIIFYSIIEELGLEIRASKKNPSKINGKWNPKIKAELESRLSKSNININETIDWSLRSTPTKIEKFKNLPLVKKSNWSTFNIRDSEILIVDAIAHVSWLRSKIASHKLNKAFTSLSIYDVANVNLLVRRLLLESLRMFW
ncbi:MAG: hypothetical protein A2V66_10595 [Ignavibacteria bacterium RBG_13_36_8]|nr:MAG: hypothetical protein A2V66_10595 [Ignavibacteria bacterium RBG_13_36_8]